MSFRKATTVSLSGFPVPSQEADESLCLGRNRRRGGLAGEEEMRSAASRESSVPFSVLGAVRPPAERPPRGCLAAMSLLSQMPVSALGWDSVSPPWAGPPRAPSPGLREPRAGVRIRSALPQTASSRGQRCPWPEPCRAGPCPDRSERPARGAERVWRQAEQCERVTGQGFSVSLIKRRPLCAS